VRKSIFAAIACLLLTAQTPVWYPPMAPPAETVPVEPPSEIIKRRALQMGYWLNGDSMVREPSLGSIDVSEIVRIPDLPPESTIPSFPRR
jgi:hypothetical protein